MGQQESHNSLNSGRVHAQNVSQGLQSHRNIHKQKNSDTKEQRVCIDGVLKLQDVPFKNSIEIQTNDSEALFLESAEMTLKYLLESRLNTTKLFPVEDIERLIESVVYTLAYLQSRKITYKDVSSNNIFYDNGSFKLLPNELVEASTYQRLLASASEYKVGEGNEDNIAQDDQQASPHKQFVCVSPELIIALRCNQTEVTDSQILQKTNVFCLGMQLLEATTLLPSSECYDIETYDILDKIVTERIMLVEEFYDQKIARIIANMLDYDYSQRMGMKQLSVWINRQMNHRIELASSQIGKQPQENDKPEVKNNICKSRMINSRTDKTLSKTNNKELKVDLGTSGTQGKVGKSNVVYLSKAQQASSLGNNCKDDKNKIYLNECRSQVQLMASQIANNDRKNNLSVQYAQHGLDRLHYMNQAQGSYSMNLNGSEKGKQKYIGRCQAAYKLTDPNKREKHSVYVDKVRQKATRRIQAGQQNQSEPYVYNQYGSPKPCEQNSKQYAQTRSKYSQTAKNEGFPLKQTNKYYPSMDQLFQDKSYGKISSLPYADSWDNGEENHPTAKFRKGQDDKPLRSRNERALTGFRPLGELGIRETREDHSISKIKGEIQKSRRLIEEFRRNEGIKH